MAYIDHHILRLMHFDNLEHILKHGIYSKNSGHIIPDYVNIGDTTLIKQRETFTVRIDPPILKKSLFMLSVKYLIL